jgi:hypothetical protein
MKPEVKVKGKVVMKFLEKQIEIARRWDNVQFWCR